jgi:hypothetical protein
VSNSVVKLKAMCGRRFVASSQHREMYAFGRSESSIMSEIGHWPCLCRQNDAPFKSERRETTTPEYSMSQGSSNHRRVCPTTAPVTQREKRIAAAFAAGSATSAQLGGTGR